MILLTGASGFLGQAILESGTQSNRRFRTLGRNQTSHDDHHSFDLTTGEPPAGVFDGVDSAIHAAGLAHQFGASALNRNKFWSVNVDATANFVSSAVKHGVGKIVVVSSMAVYGPGSGRAHQENDPCNPQGHYGESKLAAETAAVDAVRGSKSKLVVLRMSTLYGEGDQGNVNRLIRAIDKGRFFLVGDCENQKNLLYRLDAAEACLLATSAGRDQVSIFNVASEPIRMIEVVETICTNLNRKLPYRVPDLAVRSLNSISRFLGRLGPLGRVQDSIEKFKRTDLIDGQLFQKHFRFQPKVNLADGIGRQVSQFRVERNKS